MTSKFKDEPKLWKANKKHFDYSIKAYVPWLNDQFCEYIQKARILFKLSRWRLNDHFFGFLVTIILVILLCVSWDLQCLWFHLQFLLKAKHISMKWFYSSNLDSYFQRTNFRAWSAMWGINWFKDLASNLLQCFVTIRELWDVGSIIFFSVRARTP